jgi:hypothetical protein
MGKCSLGKGKRGVRGKSPREYAADMKQGGSVVMPLLTLWAGGKRGKS